MEKITTISLSLENAVNPLPKFRIETDGEKQRIWIRTNERTEMRFSEDGEQICYLYDTIEATGSGFDADRIQPDPEAYYEKLAAWTPDPKPDPDDQVQRIADLEAALAVLTGGNV